MCFIKFRRILLLPTFILAIACSKDEQGHKTPVDNSIDASVYFPMNTGSYWVYDVFSIDTSGAETLIGVDTVEVIGDTLYRNKTFKQISSRFPHYAPDWLADSNGVLIDSLGNRLFSPNQLGEIIDTGQMPKVTTNPIFSYKVRMSAETSIISVPAGSFDVLKQISEYTLEQENPKRKRVLERTRAANVGIITTQYTSAYDPNIYEKRLVKYEVQ